MSDEAKRVAVEIVTGRRIFEAATWRVRDDGYLSVFAHLSESDVLTAEFPPGSWAAVFYESAEVQS